MEIKLTKGKIAFVDDEDYDLLKHYRWFAFKDHRFWYARAWTRDIDGKRIILFMHRLILGNPCEGLLVDHINHDGLDNRKSNLRACTNAENLRNKLPRRELPKGFYFCDDEKRKKPWRAKIRGDGKSLHLGYFSSKKEATEAYNKAAGSYFGEFACLNT